MANDLNQCNFIGRLGKSVELRYTPNGKAVANFSIAVGQTYPQESTTWVNIVMWGKLAEAASQYLDKGSQIFISGRMENRSWEDRDGNKRYTTEIVVQNMQMLGGRGVKEPPAEEPISVPNEDVTF